MKKEQNSGVQLEQQPQFNLALTADYFANPYQWYEQMRDMAPVVWVESLHSWLVLGYDECVQTLQSSTFSVNRKQSFFSELDTNQRADLQPLEDFFKLWLMFMDPPGHDKLRRAVHKPFTASAVALYTDKLSHLVDVGWNRAPKKLDFLHDFAAPLAVESIATFMGIDPDEYAEVAGWSETLLTFIGGKRADYEQGKAALACHAQLEEYVRKQLAQRSKEEDGTVMSSLLSAIENNSLTEQEVVAIIANILIDGHDPIAHTLTNAVHCLATHPDQLTTLHTNPDMSASALEEVLRYQPYFQYAARQLTTDEHIGEVQLSEGDRVMCMIAAANRDPKVFEAAQAFDIQRQKNPHLSFGRGIHYCIGASLARHVTHLALQKISQHTSSITLLNSVEWNHSVGYRGLKHLPVELQ